MHFASSKSTKKAVPLKWVSFWSNKALKPGLWPLSVLLTTLLESQQALNKKYR